MNAKQVFKMLQNEGWVYKRTKGSHWIFTKNGKIVSVPFHGGSKDIAIGTLLHILRDADLR